MSAGPRTYDALIVGAGHNGLCLAVHLQRAGLQCLVLEGAPRLGGMTRTESHGGFRHEAHAELLSFLDLMPLAPDLERFGLRTAWPDAQYGITFADGRPPLVLHRPDARDATTASLARAAPRDAATFTDLARAVDDLTPLLARGLFAPPERTWFERQREALHGIASRFGVASGLGRGTARALIDALFETPDLRTLLYQAAAEFGVRLETEGGDLGFLGVTLWMIGRRRVPLGGMQAVPDALARAARHAGAEVAEGTRVTRILVRRGHASGVRLEDGSEIRAARLIASSAGFAGTLLDLIGPELLQTSDADDARAFAAQPSPTLAALMFGLREAPAYHSARWSADIGRCLQTVIGFETPDEVLQHLRAIELGCLADSAAAVRTLSLWDAARAPPGAHTATADVFLPSPESLQAEEWDVVQSGVAEAFADTWRRYASNLGPETFLAARAVLAGDYERKLRLREGAAQYRTAIGNLYLCSAATYPGGGVHGACGRNAFAVIAADLGLANA